MFDITKKRAAETAQIELVTGEGSPLTDDDGNVLGVTVFGPGSKRWQQADADRNRKRSNRIQKNKNNIAAAIDGGKEDEIAFLTAITISFDGWEYPNPETDDEGKAKEWPAKADMFRAAFEDDAIGYIRDHVHKEANDWAAFTRG